MRSGQRDADGRCSYRENIPALTGLPTTMATFRTKDRSGQREGNGVVVGTMPDDRSAPVGVELWNGLCSDLRNG